MAVKNNTSLNSAMSLSDCNGVIGFIQELRADKDLNSLVVDCLVNANRVLPSDYQQLNLVYTI